MTILTVFYRSTHIKPKTVCIPLIFTAYMVRTVLNFLCVQSGKWCVHTQYASLSTSLLRDDLDFKSFRPVFFNLSVFRSADRNFTQNGKKIKLIFFNFYFSVTFRHSGRRYLLLSLCAAQMLTPSLLNKCAIRHAQRNVKSINFFSRFSLVDCQFYFWLLTNQFFRYILHASET